MEGKLAVIMAACISLWTCAAAEYEMPGLPPGTLPDTEVSTNVSLLACSPGRHQAFSLKLQVGNCSSNEVLVAIGHDADGNGDLAFDETDLVFGCDCGERYFVDYTAQRARVDVGESILIRHRDYNPAWDLAKVVKRGEGDVGEVITVSLETRAFSVILW